MGKRIEDLPLSDIPIDDTPLADATVDIRATPWFQFIGDLDELIDSEQYAFAYDTLVGIRETVERTRRVSEGQRAAVANIVAGGDRQSRSRRYRWRR